MFSFFLLKYNTKITQNHEVSISVTIQISSDCHRWLLQVVAGSIKLCRTAALNLQVWFLKITEPLRAHRGHSCVLTFTVAVVAPDAVHSASSFRSALIWLHLICDENHLTPLCTWRRACRCRHDHLWCLSSECCQSNLRFPPNRNGRTS